MEVSQIYEIVNAITTESLGEGSVVNEDLSNVVEIGETISNLSSAAFENYTRSLIDHIGRVVFVNRPYSGSAPSVLMDSWEYGSILEKIQAEMPEAQANDSWDLQDGYVYEQDKFKKPNVSAKFFNSKTTFETQMSFAERQVKSAFDSVGQLNAFFSMIDTAIYNGQTVKTDGLVMRVINNAIANTINAEFAGGSGYDASSGVRAVNLLYLYNQAHSGATLANLGAAMASPEFIRFAAYTMSLYQDRMRKLSKLFNIGQKARFTPADRLHFIMLNDFAKAADVYNQSDTFHEQFTRLPNAETVPYWQGSGTGYALDSISSINVTVNAETGASATQTISATGIIGVMFDRDALGVCNQDRRVTTHYNARAEFFNNWYKVDAQYFNDFNENCVVFYAAVPAN